MRFVFGLWNSGTWESGAVRRTGGGRSLSCSEEEFVNALLGPSAAPQENISPTAARRPWPFATTHVVVAASLWQGHVQGKQTHAYRTDITRTVTLPCLLWYSLSSLGPAMTPNFESTFPDVVGEPLVMDSQMSALNLVARIDVMFFVELEIQCDGEVCGVGLRAATAIIEGAQVDETLLKAKVEVWKLEGVAIDSLMTRYAARHQGGIPIDQLQQDLKIRRERVSSKFVKRLDLVKKASDQVEEARNMQQEMKDTLSKAEKRLDELFVSKESLTLAILGLRDALVELKRVREESVIPLMRRLSAIQIRRRGVAVQAIERFRRSRRWIPRLISALQLLGGTNVEYLISAFTVDSVANRIEQQRLSESCRKDKALCQQVQNELEGLAVQLQHFYVPSAEGLLAKDLKLFSFNESFSQSRFCCVPGVPLVTSFVDAASFNMETRATSIEEVEAGKRDIEQLLEMLNTQTDFWQIHLATKRAKPDFARRKSTSPPNSELPPSLDRVRSAP